MRALTANIFGNTFSPFFLFFLQNSNSPINTTLIFTALEYKIITVGCSDLAVYEKPNTDIGSCLVTYELHECLIAAG